jgi:2,4-dienoyl-CoA reductase (NADPH2)
MEMEQPEIDELVAGFAEAARLAVRSGVDGIEVDAGVRSLLRQFHSGLTNMRSDAYGADRIKITREVLRATRDAIGPGRILALRLSCDEMAPWAGVTPEMAADQLRALAPLLDLVVVVKGGLYSVASYRPDGHIDEGFNSELCREMRRAANGAVALALQGSVVDPWQAESMLNDGFADVVEMTRAQIADPDLIVKAETGRQREIRPCVLCNQLCLVRDNRNPIVTCIAEPRSGHETQDPSEAGSVVAANEVLIVGAGPAGLEAARVLAGRGIPVRVAERRSSSAGMLRLIAAAPGRARFALLADWFEGECRRLGVSIDTNVEITSADFDERVESGSAVLLATGGRPGPYPCPVGKGVMTLGPEEILAAGDAPGTVVPEGPIVVVDPVGGPVAVAVAELLAAAGRSVAFVTSDQIVGTLLSLSGDLVGANIRLQRAGVTRHTGALLRGVSDGVAILEDRWDGSRREIPCAALIDCGHRLPEEALYLGHPGTPRAGDCVAPRSVHEAVLEGRRIATALAGHLAVQATPAGAAHPA